MTDRNLKLETQPTFYELGHMILTKNQKGFSLTDLLIVFAILSIIAVTAIPNILASRSAANEGAAISSLKSLYQANLAYKSSIGSGKFAPTLSVLHSHGLIDDDLLKALNENNPASGRSYKYDGTMVNENPSKFTIVTNHPESAASTSAHSFFIDETGIIRYSTGTFIPDKTSAPLTK